MENREAGLVLGEGAEPFVSFMASVFESDWEQATEYTVQQSYSSNDMYEITKTSSMPVDIPAPRSYPGAYVTPFPEAVVGYMDSTLYASPDYARSVLMKDIEAATSSFDLMMYQVERVRGCLQCVASAREPYAGWTHPPRSRMRACARRSWACSRVAWS